MTGGQVSKLIGEIYDAAEDSSRWSVFLESFAEQMGAAHTIICIIDWRDATSRVGAYVRSSPETIAEYDRNWSGETNPYIRSGHPLMRVDGSVVRGKQLVPHDRMVRTPYYNEFLGSAGIEELVGLNIYTHGPWMAAVTTHYGRSRGDPDDDRLKLCRWLMPHLRNAVALHLRLGRSEAERDSLEAEFDSVQLGVAVVDRRGRLLRTNKEADRILAEKDGLEARFNSISTFVSRTQDRLLGLISHAAKTGDRRSLYPGGSLAVHRFSGKPPYVLNVSPVGLNGPMYLRHGGGAVVFIKDPSRLPKPSSQRLREMFGLTAAEVRVATLLADEDLTRPQVAERLGVTENTVRTHARNIYAKVGVRSRAALARRLSGILV